VNRVLALFGRPSPDRQFYQAVFQQLVEKYPLPDNELHVLATRRAQVIVEYLTGSAGIEPSRLESGEAGAVNAPSDRAVTTQAALDVVKTPGEAGSSPRSDLEKVVPTSDDLRVGSARSRTPEWDGATGSWAGDRGGRDHHPDPALYDANARFMRQARC